MKSLLVLIFAILVTSCASSPPMPTPIGEGRYLLAGRDATIFGSYGEKVAELMGQANTFCQQQGKSAVLEDSSGNDASPGATGIVNRPGQTASATITFRCK